MKLKVPTAPQADSKAWWFWERFTSVHEFAYRSTGGRIGGRFQRAPMLLLDTVGRKSGKRRTHPLIGFEDGDNLVVIASKGGIDKHPAWWHNLRAMDSTEVNWYGDKRVVAPREADGPERDRLWNRAVELYPQYADYEARTERRIPVVVLEPAGERG